MVSKTKLMFFVCIILLVSITIGGFFFSHFSESKTARNLNNLFTTDELHPAWYDSNYEYKRNITNASANLLLPLNCDGGTSCTSDIDGNGNDEVLYGVPSGSSAGVYYNDDTDAVVANDSTETCIIDTANDRSSCPNSPAGLISHYALDRDSGDVRDYIGSNDGQNEGAERGVEGIINNAFDFDSSESDYVSIPISPPSQYSIFMWVNVDTHNVHEDYGACFWTWDEGGGNHNHDFRICIDDTGEYFAKWDTNTEDATQLDSGTTLNTGQWYHIGFTQNSDTATIYVNGDAKETKNIDAHLSGNTDAFIGRYFTSSSGVDIYDGKIDEVQIYDKVLSSSEVQTLHEKSNHVSLDAEEVENAVPEITLNNPENDSKVFGTSATLNVTVIDEDGDDMDVRFYDASDDSLITEETGVTNGSDVTYEWSNLGEGEHSWYVNATDGTDTTTSDTWNFETTSLETTVPEIYNSTEDEQSIFSVTDEIIMKFNSTHIDGGSSIDDIYLSLIDPTGGVQIANESVLEFYDGYGDGDSGDWSDPDNNYVEDSGFYKYGYSGDYFSESLIDESVIDDKSEGTISMDLNVKNNAEHNSRIIMRWKDEDNYVAAFATQEYSSMGIEEYVDGNRDFVETSKPFSTDTWYDMKMKIEGDTATLYWEDNEIISKELSVTDAGQMGIMTDASEVWYDNYSIGYPDSSQTSITDGFRSTYEYTIPDNISLGGTWTVNAYTSSGETIESNEDTFFVASEKPSIIDTRVLNTTNNNAGEERRIQADVIHGTPSDIDTVFVNITSSNGTQVKTEETATQIESIDNGYRYEYNYTPDKRLDSEGDWNYDFWVNDTEGETDTEDSSFYVNVPSPEINNIRKIKNGEEKDVFLFGDSISIKGDITDEDGEEDIDSVKIDITHPNGTKIVDGENMSVESSITNGSVYNYDYDVSEKREDMGSYEINITAKDDDYSPSEISSFILYWAKADYYYRQELSLVDEFDIEREENIGLNITADDSNLDCENIFISNSLGEEVNYSITEDTLNSNRTCLIETIADTSTDLRYYVYYNNSGTSNNKSVEQFNISVQETDFDFIDASDFFDNYDEDNEATFTLDWVAADIDEDGETERLATGRTDNQSDINEHTYIRVLEENGTTSQTYKWQDGEFSGGYDIRYGNFIDDNEGDEIAVIGYSYDGTDGHRQGAIWYLDYVDGEFVHLDEVFWDNGDETQAFTSEEKDYTDDGTLELVTGGLAQGGTDYAQMKVWDETTELASDNWGLGNERDRIFDLTLADLDDDGTEEIIGAGTTKLDYDNCEGGLMLNASILIYNYTDESLNQELVHTYNKDDLTEIFGLTSGDINGDGISELISTGNWYDCDAGNDIAEVRAWNYDGSEITLMDNVEYPSSGHSSLLSGYWGDLNNNYKNELFAAGFSNDGTTDRGFEVILEYNGGFETVHSDYLKKNSIPVRDADYGGNFILTDLDEDGIKEITTGGRYGQSRPIKTYNYEREVGGITTTYSTEEEINYAPYEPTLNSPENEEENISWSPTLNVTVTDPDDELLNVSFYNADGDDLIGEDLNVENDSEATYEWNNLDDNKTYEWYVKSTDGISITQSDTWNFTTITDYPPKITSMIPENDSAYSIENNNISFTCEGEDDVGIEEMKIYIDGVEEYNSVNETNETNETNSTNETTSISKTIYREINRSNHNWSCEITDTNNQTTEENNIFYVLDAELNSPENNSTIYNPYVELNATAYGSNDMNVSFNGIPNRDSFDRDSFEEDFDGWSYDTGPDGEPLANNQRVESWSSHKNWSFKISDYKTRKEKDLSSVYSIVFDLNVTSEAQGSTSFSIDGDDYWTSNGTGEYLNITIDTSSINNKANLSFSAPGLDFDDSEMHIDNIRYLNSTLNEDENVADGSEATYEWTDLNKNTTYDWFVDTSYKDTTYTTETYTFATDSVPPSINATTNQTTVDWGSNIKLLYNITDNADNLDDCWYNYNGSNNSLTCGTELEEEITTSEGEHIITVYANDTLGNQNSEEVVFNQQLNIDLLEPVNNSNLSYSDVFFNGEIYEESEDYTVGIKNASLYVDGDVVESWENDNETITSKSINETVNLSDGNHEWYVVAYDFDNKSYASETNTLLVDTIYPEINITYGDGIYDYYISGEDKNHTINFTVTDDNLDNESGRFVYPYRNTELIKGGTQEISDLNFSNYDTADNYRYLNFTDVDENYTIHSKWYKPSSGGFVQPIFIEYHFKAWNYTSESWETIRTFGASSSGDSAGSDSEIYDDAVKEDFLNGEGLLRLRYPDKGRLYESMISKSENLTNLENNSENSISIFKIAEEFYTARLFINDISGNTQEETVEWDYYVTENNVTYTEEAFESNPNDIVGNFTLYEQPDSIKVNYKGTNYTPSVSTDGDEYIVELDDDIPTVDEDTIADFYFIFEFEDETVKTQTYNQTILDVSLTTDCEDNYLALNITNWDEETLEKINGSIDYKMTIYDSEKNELDILSGQDLEGEEIQLCSVINISDLEGYYGLEVRYTATDYHYKTYNIDYSHLNNLPIDLKLYYLLESSGHEFEISYEDEDYLERPGAIIQIQKQYLDEDTYRTVEVPMISDDGTTTGVLSTEEIRYKMVVIEDGEIVDVFRNVFPECLRPEYETCTLELSGYEGDEPVVEEEDFTYILERVNDSIELTYSIPSGTPKDVELRTKQDSRFMDNVSSCSTSTYSSGGTLICDFNETVGDSSIQTTVFVDNEKFLQGDIRIGERIAEAFSSNNYLIAFILLLSLVLIFITSGIMMIISAIGGLFYIGLIFLIEMGSLNIFTVSTSLMWLIIAAGIIIYKLSQKEERI